MSDGNKCVEIDDFHKGIVSWYSFRTKINTANPMSRVKFLEWYICCIWFQSYTIILSSGHIIYTVYTILCIDCNWAHMTCTTLIDLPELFNSREIFCDFHPWKDACFFFRTDIRSLKPERGKWHLPNPSWTSKASFPQEVAMSLTHNVAAFFFGLRHDISLWSIAFFRSSWLKGLKVTIMPSSINFQQPELDFSRFWTWNRTL